MAFITLKFKGIFLQNLDCPVEYQYIIDRTSFWPSGGILKAINVNMFRLPSKYMLSPVGFVQNNFWWVCHTYRDTESHVSCS
jgi:hypothetical protein